MRWYWYVVIGLAILAGLLGVRWAVDWFRSHRAQKLAQPHLERCTKECDQSVQKRIAELREYFAKKRKNCRAFAEEVLSFSSKVKLLFSGNQHVQEAFHRHIFWPEELEDQIRHTVRLCLQDIQDAENKMLVALQADLATHFPELLVTAVPKEELLRFYENALRETNERIWASLKEDVVREICVTVASEVLAVVIRQLTIRSTTLTIGAGSGWFTFGAGLVIALILDYIWDWWSDPTGELATKLEGELTQLEKLIIEGTGNEGGLQARLGQLSQERASARERAIMALLKKQKQ